MYQTISGNVIKDSFKKTLWPLFMDGVQLPQGYNCTIQETAPSGHHQAHCQAIIRSLPHQAIPRNIIKDSRECSKGFQKMFQKISRICPEDSTECSRKFERILMKILRDVKEDSCESKFCEILLVLIKFCYYTAARQWKKQLLSNLSEKKLFHTTTHNYTLHTTHYSLISQA